MKKKMLFTLILFITLLLTGCGAKETLESSTFKTIMEKKNFNVIDQTSSVISENSAVEISYYAETQDKRYAIEYYSFNGEVPAQAFYAKQQAILGSTGSQATTEVNVGNYSKYTMIHNGKFTAISRVSNTVVYVNANNDYANEIKTLLKDIGY